MKILHMKELILLIINVEQYHSVPPQKKIGSYFRVTPKPGVEPGTSRTISELARISPKM